MAVILYVAALSADGLGSGCSKPGPLMHDPDDSTPDAATSFGASGAANDGAPDDLIGHVVGTYRIDARLGAGGMGEVYRASDMRLNRPVALKWLPRSMTHSAERLLRFRMEAMAASSLNHPHILVVHDFGEEGGRPYIVTEFVEGESLRQRLEGGALPLAAAVEIAGQVAEALAAAHARGIVHRDIKPENIMLRPDGHVKVVDFGIAKVVAPGDGGGAASSTQEGVIIGTPRYMSPEQLRGAAVDARSDIWSLGVTLYEMIAGHHPFPETAGADLIGAILHRAPVVEAVGAAHAVVARALHKNPLERHTDAHALMLELRQLSKDLATEDTERSPRAPDGSRAHNFPLQLTSFIGREDDSVGVQHGLHASRLVTLTGAGGVGKTRLALQIGAAVAQDFADGAWLVDLSPIADPALVSIAIADVFRVPHRHDRPVLETLCEHLRSRALLLVLDNCEHLIDACALVVERLLASCGAVSVLATSRETLNLPGEVIWRLRSLGTPEPGVTDADAIERSESGRLFVQRARAARPTFELTSENAASITQICRRLDGLPLAIELAAARVGALSPIEIAERLDDRFRLLTGGSRRAVPRQRTLEATVQWSYELLPADERLLFTRLSVFVGGCTLDACEEVCSDARLARSQMADRIAHLVERSMVVADDTAGERLRYRMLETLRQFGRDQLVASGETPAVRDRHLGWALTLAEGTAARVEHQHAAHIAIETDNIRAALEWAYETGRYESGLRIMAAARVGHLDERTRLLKALLTYADTTPIDVQAKGLFTAGGLAFMIGDWSWGVDAMSRAADLFARTGDTMRRSMSLTYLGACHWGLGQMPQALEALDRALADARAAQSVDATARALLIRAWLETERDLDRADAMAAEAELLAAALPNSFDIGHVGELRGFIHGRKGDFAAAAAALADALRIFKTIQINCGAHVLETAAAWAAMTERFELGAELLGSAHRIREETGDNPRPWEHEVQREWLPRIAAALIPALFDAAWRRGLQRPFAAALDFAEHELRALSEGHQTA